MLDNNECDYSKTIPTNTIPNDRLISILLLTVNSGNSLKFSAPGKSMFPFVQSGDIITIAPVTEIIEYGDIVAAITDTHRIIIHRVVGQRSGQFLLKGDNSIHDDGYFYRNNIIGKLVEIQRGDACLRFGGSIGKRIIAFLSSNNRNDILHFMHRGLSIFTSHNWIIQ